jgi:hypothetical protein
MLKNTRMLSRVAIAQLPRGRFAIAVTLTLMSTFPNFTSSLWQCSTRGCNSRERSYVCVPVKCSVCKYTQYTPVQRRLCTHVWNDIWVHFCEMSLFFSQENVACVQYCRPLVHFCKMSSIFRWKNKTELKVCGRKILFYQPTWFGLLLLSSILFLYHNVSSCDKLWVTSTLMVQALAWSFGSFSNHCPWVFIYQPFCHLSSCAIHFLSCILYCSVSRTVCIMYCSVLRTVLCTVLYHVMFCVVYCSVLCTVLYHVLFYVVYCSVSCTVLYHVLLCIMTSVLC